MGRPTGAHVCGPLQPLVRGFLFELIELGYGWTAQRSRLRLLAELSSWMAARNIGQDDLTQLVIEEFLGQVRTSTLGRRWCSASSERQLLAYLREHGFVPEPEMPVLSDPVEGLAARFGEYLVCERGLAVGSSTVRDYRRIARLFLSEHVGPESDLDQLTAADVTGFVLAECRRLGSARSKKLIVTVLTQFPHIRWSFSSPSLGVR